MAAVDAVIVALFAWLVIVPAVVAVVALPLKAAVIVPAEKLPEASRATIVDAVLALVALEVTVNVAALDWLAVKVCDPDKPVPDTASVNVPLFTLAAVVAVVAFPDKAAVIVPAEKFPDASRATMVEAVLTDVAFEVTVNELAPAWLAVKEAEPDRPVPDTAIVNAPLLAAATGATQEGAAAPFD